MTAAPDLPTAPATAEALSSAAHPVESTTADLDRAIAELRDHARAFARMPPREKAAILREIVPLALRAAPRMVAEGCRAKGIDPDGPLAGEEWLGGACPFILNVRLLAEAL